MKIFQFAVIMAFIGFGLPLITACEDEGAFEELGENIDETGEEAGDRIEETTDQ